MRHILIYTLVNISIVNTHLYNYIARKYITYIYGNIYKNICQVKYEPGFSGL